MTELRQLRKLFQMNIEREDQARHPIRVVAKRTGLAPALLRAWERRYTVVRPSRTDGGQRLYSDADVHKLTLLCQVIDEGRRIGQVAMLSPSALERLVAEDRARGRRFPRRLNSLSEESAEGLFLRAEEEVRGGDPEELERVLFRGTLALPFSALMDEVLVPLLEGICEGWWEGELGATREYRAKAVIRRFLEWLLNSLGGGESGPTFLAATPRGEGNELGALLTTVSAAAGGWRALFLGTNLPASDIAAGAQEVEAQVVALTVMDRALAGGLKEELEALRGLLPPSVRILLGGPREVVSRIPDRIRGVEVLESLGALRGRLHEPSAL